MSVAIPRKFYQPLLIAGALAFVYFTVLEKLGRDWWHDENYSHGLLIPFVIGYILWQGRKRFQASQTRPAVWFGAISGCPNPACRLVRSHRRNNIFAGALGWNGRS